MKESEQYDILIEKPLAIESGFSMGVTIEVSSAHSPIAPYATVAPVP